MAKSSCCASIRICNQISSIHIESQPWFCTLVTLELGGRIQGRKITEDCWPASQANEKYREDPPQDSTCVRDRASWALGSEKDCLKGNR